MRQGARRGSDLDALLTASGFEIVAASSNVTPRTHWLVRHAVPAAREPTSGCG
jgi:hypothetical protein